MRVRLGLLAISFSLVLALPVLALDTPINPPAEPATQTSPAGSASVVAPPAKKKFNLSATQEALQISDDIELAQKQVAAHPDDPEAHFLLAAAYSRSPYMMEAYQEIRKTKNLLKEKQDFEFIDRMIPQYEKLSMQRKNDSVVLYRLALAYYLKGYTVEKYPHHYKTQPTGAPTEYYEKAQNTMQNVIALNPKDTWARNYYGYLLTQNGKDLSKGVPVWQESLSIDSENNPGALFMLSQAAIAQGDIRSSLEYGAKFLVVKQRMGMVTP